MTCPPHSLKPTRRSGPSKQFIKRARPAHRLVFLSNHSFPRARLVNAMCPPSTGHQSIFLDEMRYPLTTQQSANCCSQACQFGWPIKLVCLSFPASRSSPVNAQRIDQRSRAGPGFLLTSFSLEPRAVTCHSAHSILLVALFLSSRHQHFFHKKGTNPSSARHPMIGRRVDSFFVVAALLALLVPLSATEPAEPSNEQSPEVEKRMLSYADLMNNFGGPSPLDFFGAPGNSLFMLDEERPKRELEEADDEVLGLWKRSPRGFLNGGQRNYLMKKDEFVAPGVLRFGKRMPGVLRFGKRNPVIHEKKAVPGVLRFGKRDAPEGSVPGVLRFGKRMPQVLRFGRR